MSSYKIISFTGTYEEKYYPGSEFTDCSDITGTDMYCDEEAEKEIVRRCIQTAKGIHLIDSGNYHYMSRLFTSRIDRDYELVFFDNHTDMKPAMFDMLSCGSWAKEVLEKDKNLQRILMIGPPDKSISELPDEIRNNEKLVIISREELEDILPGKDDKEEMKLPEKVGTGKALPLYISVDKDVLDISEVRTNWDQGSLTMKKLVFLIEKICEGRVLIGADICGLFPVSAGESGAASEYERGVETDRKLIDVLNRFIP